MAIAGVGVAGVVAIVVAGVAGVVVASSQQGVAIIPVATEEVFALQKMTTLKWIFKKLMQHVVFIFDFFWSYVDTLGLGISLSLWGGGGQGHGEEGEGEDSGELHLDQDGCCCLVKLIEDLEDLWPSSIGEVDLYGEFLRISRSPVFQSVR